MNRSMEQEHMSVMGWKLVKDFHFCLFIPFLVASDASDVSLNDTQIWNEKG